MAFSEDGRFIGLACSRWSAPGPLGSSIQVRNARDGATVSTTRGTEGKVSCLAFDPAGDLLALSRGASDSVEIARLDVRAGKLKSVVKVARPGWIPPMVRLEHRRDPKWRPEVGLSPGGGYLVQSDVGDRVFVSSARTGKLLHILGSKPAPTEPDSDSPRYDRFESPGYIGFASGDRLLYVARPGSYGRSARTEVWDMRSGGMRSVVATFDGDNIFAAGRSIMVSNGGSMGCVTVADRRTGRERATMVRLTYEQTHDIAWVAVTPDGYFTLNANAYPYLVRKVGRTYVPLSRTSQVFHRSDLVRRALRGGA